MHITAHPDDEHGGVLAKLSLGDGARVTLLTLNRGESGDNAIGPQLFDALGLIRTEELLAAGRYYGIDQQYFTTVVDYGFSKTLEESISQVGTRDGAARRGAHHPDGAADDPAVAIPGQRARRARQSPGGRTDGARGVSRRGRSEPIYRSDSRRACAPWQPAKLFIGGVRENEEWTVRVDSGEYSPVLGDSFDNVARRGLSFQRSQNGGRFTPTIGIGVFVLRRSER